MSPVYLWPVSPIYLWPFHDAPIEYRKLSTCGGDEDWLAFVPSSIKHEPPWFEYVPMADVDRFPVDGGTVLIWSHG